jgi:hypothetical protein
MTQIDAMTQIDVMTQIDMCPKTLRGTNLRYTLTRLLQLCGPSTVDELIVALRQWGFTVDGRPSKTVSDALRWERRLGRVRRIGRGRYRAGEMPRGTEHRIIQRVRFLRGEATPEQAGRGGRATRGRARSASVSSREARADSPGSCR